MKRLCTALFVLLLLPAGPLLGQDRMAHDHGDHNAVGSVAPLFETVRGYLMAAAEQMPEDLYGFRPTEEVRSFGQIIGHVANVQYFFCGSAAGGQAQPPEDFEERTTKAGLVEALEMGFQACEEAYAMDDEMAMSQVEFFGTTGSRLWVLNFNNAHNWEHYGNLVVYFRANGMVPPSSQGQMGQ